MANLFLDTGGNPELYFSNKKARIILTDMNDGANGEFTLTSGTWTAEQLANLVNDVERFVDGVVNMYGANGEFTLTICFDGGGDGDK